MYVVSHPGRDEAFVDAVEPGDYRVRCKGGPAVPFTVLDPGEHYRGFELACPDPVGGGGEYGLGIGSAAADPIELVRQTFAQPGRGLFLLAPADDLQRYGYLGSPDHAIVGVVHDGRLGLILRLNTSAGEWSVDGTVACPQK